MVIERTVGFDVALLSEHRQRQDLVELDLKHPTNPFVLQLIIAVIEHIVWVSEGSYQTIGLIQTLRGPEEVTPFSATVTKLNV